jgi:nucleotide-binding universal stress UspA family protein
VIDKIYQDHAKIQFETVSHRSLLKGRQEVTVKRFKNILVILNSEGLSHAVLARAVWLAHANAATLTLFAVQESGDVDLNWLAANLSGSGAPDLSARLAAALQDDLNEIAHSLTTADGIAPDRIRTVVTRGSGHIEIIRQVLRAQHDLVLKGADQSFDWRTLGGADLNLLRKCPCPVWILNSAVEPKAERIMATVVPDSEDTMRTALNHKVMQVAPSLAVQDSARLDVLHAWYLYDEHLLRGRRSYTPGKEVDALLEKTRRQSRWALNQLTQDYGGIAPETQVLHVKGLPADVITQHAEDQRIDTLVMGTRARDGLTGMLIGNTSETVLNRVKCSVLVVKPDNFISPIGL